MKTIKQNSDFLHIGEKLLLWYRQNARILPWRETKNPYHIWISEIILQQTRVEQGKNYYIRFLERFPDINSLAKADTHEILLYWKGLGYYSRALNLHKAAQQVMEQYNGVFPTDYQQIIKLKGIGEYTAAAISSICFNAKIPAVDGNFYRVLSRIFADDFDISQSKAHDYFANLALLIMPDRDFGDFNQAIMDLGANVCKPKNPDCGNCPIQNDCLAFQMGKTQDFPVKTKKTKVEDLSLHYYFIRFNDQILIKQRGEDFIWKKLYDLPEKINPDLKKLIVREEKILHKLSHKNLTLHFYTIIIYEKTVFVKFQKEYNLEILSLNEIESKSFPKPIENFIKNK